MSESDRVEAKYGIGEFRGVERLGADYGWDAFVTHRRMEPLSLKSLCPRGFDEGAGVTGMWGPDLS